MEIITAGFKQEEEKERKGYGSRNYGRTYVSNLRFKTKKHMRNYSVITEPDND